MIARIFRAGIFLCLALLAAVPIVAAGGTCPSGNTTIDPNGNPISLASLGVTNCFYVSKSTGADTNAGTSETAPWAHLPGMPSCTGVCASTTPSAGQGFILRGGEVWVTSDLGVQWTWSGKTSNLIYIGIDPGWYNSAICGASWCRPIFNAGQTALSANGAVFGLNNQSWVIVDNLEVKGPTNNYAVYDAQGNGTNIRITQSYTHGWTHTGGGNNDGVFRDGGVGTVADHFIIDGSDSSKNTYNGVFGSWSQVQYGYISYVVSGVLGSTDIVHDISIYNTVTSVDGDHCNGLFNFSPGPSGLLLIYNNLLDGGDTCSGGVVLWFNGNGGTTPSQQMYGFNNIIVNTSSNPLNIGNHGSGNYGTLYWFNNTVDCTMGGCGGAPPSGPYWTIYDNNNMVVGGPLQLTPSGGSAPVCSNGTGGGCTDWSPSSSTATTQGYSLSASFPYSPLSSCTSSTCRTVNSGTNVESYCTTLSSINSTAATACRYSASVGCAYNKTNHTLNCPNDPQMARPSTGAWDIGAYLVQSNPLPTAPTNLLAVVQ